MEKFQIISPSPTLAPFIKCYWLLESDDTNNSQRIIPSGSASLVFHRGVQMKNSDGIIARTFLCGQHTTFSDIKPMGLVNMIAVVFHPFGARAFFNLPIYELSGLNVSAEDMSNKALKQLEDKILNTTDDLLCISMIETFLMGELNPFKEYNYKRLVATVDAINVRGCEITVPQLAEIACVSTKQLHRIFDDHIGINPKEFMRIVRFQKALFTLQNEPSISFTKLAYECGYYDQSHLTNEFKLLSGYSPSGYIALCAPYSDYFSE